MPDGISINDPSKVVIRYGWKDLGTLIDSPLPGTDAITADSVELQFTPHAGFAPAPGTSLLVQDANGDGAAANVDTPTTVLVPAPAPALTAPISALFNLLNVTRGQTVPSEVLGSGNAAILNQDFTLQNAPVTYLQDAASVSGDDYSSTVRVWVNGIQWREVSSFYNQAADAQVFLTREDEQGKTHVVFNGRLPTGVNNVVASYRYGAGARTPEPGTLTVVLQPQPGLAAIANPVAPGGGADADPPAKVRTLAPLSVMTFDRAVSLDDFRVIAATAPGVTRAAAAYAFDPASQRPVVTVWVGDDEGAVAAAQKAIAATCDPNRPPLVKPATQLTMTLSLTYLQDPRYQDATVLRALQTALTDVDTGLFGVNVVGIGQVFFASQIYAACLAVPGVMAIHDLSFGAPRRFRSMVPRQFVLAGAAAPCTGERYDPGAGRYYAVPVENLQLSRKMIDVSDNYAIYYADKLWNLLPAVYRAQDTDQFGSNGPLREIVDRIGAQVANVRRNIDRMWEDQSIETCDDWAIPYIGALLGANLVSGLDPRAQRIDVAKTIYYRRRKGTVAILEEIASAITGWDAKVVEFFRRMGRTRHGLDPAIGPSPLGDDDETRLQVAEGLVGPITRTAIGGFADLRDVYGASKAGTAFDEYFHTADMRKPLGSTGWYNIPRLGVFLWRLKSYGVGPVTPVPVLGCPGWYTFDPTGRDIPLFAAGRGNDGNAFGDNWVSPAEAQLPTPISQQLLDTNAPVQPVPTPAQMDAEDAAYWWQRMQSGADQRVNLYPDDLSVTAVTNPPAGAPDSFEPAPHPARARTLPARGVASSRDRARRCLPLWFSFGHRRRPIRPPHRHAGNHDARAGRRRFRRRRGVGRVRINSLLRHPDHPGLVDLCHRSQRRAGTGLADDAVRKSAAPADSTWRRCMEHRRGRGYEPRPRRTLR